MKEKISRISRGIIDTEQPRITITPESILGEVFCGQVLKSEVRIACEDRFFLRGLVYTTDQRVKPASPYFSGSNAYIGYTVDCDRLQPGAVIDGEFRLVSSGGEFTVPYSFTVREAPETVGGAVKGGVIPVVTREDLLGELVAEKRAAQGQPKETEGAAGLSEEELHRQTDLDFYLKLLRGDHSSDLYQSFEHQMRGFVRDEIMAGHMDDRLISIYEQVLVPDMIDETLARALSAILFAHRIELPSSYKKIRIEYDEMEGGQEVPLENGRATFQLYTPNCKIFLIDGSASVCEARGLAPVPVLSNATRLMSVCARVAPGLPEYQIGIARRLARRPSLTEPEMQVLCSIAFEDGLKASFRCELLRAAICCYNWKDDPGNLHILVSCGDRAALDSDTELALTAALADAGLMDEAAKHLPRCEYRKLDPGVLAAIVRRRLSYDEPDVDPLLLEQCRYLFDEGSAGDDEMEYLCRFYNGLSSEMDAMLHRADSDGLMLSDLPERLLGQMLFTGTVDDLDYVFRCYARDTVSKRLLAAYYAVKCHRYFIYGEEPDPEIFSAVKYMVAGDLGRGEVPVIVLLAVSYYFAQHGDLEEGDRELLARIMQLLCQKGYAFPYFKKFASFIELPLETLDKTVVSYRGHESDSVSLVLIPEGDDEEPVYLEMNYVHSGIFARPLLIFEGEHFSYRIRVTSGGVTETAEEGELTADIGNTGKSRRFTRLNELLAGSADPGDPAWQRGMDGYAMDDSLCEMLFKLG